MIGGVPAITEMLAAVRAAALALASLAVALLLLWLSSCGGAQIACAKAPIVIMAHPTKPKPAGRIVVGCDGRVLLELDADEVVR